MACTGIEYCKLAIVETKARGEELVARLEERLCAFDADISIHINGCLNTCARTQVADIGLKTTAEELPAYVERLARRYLTGRTESETFAQWVIRVDEEELR